MRRSALALACGFLLLPLAARTQGLAGSASVVPPLTFAVASIRPTTSGEHDRVHIWSNPSDGNFKAQNVSVNDLLEFAFALPDSRFVSASKAVEKTVREPRFDLEARSEVELDQQLHTLPADEARQRKRELLQAMLTDRFGLKTHTEMRELPIYTLLVAKGGPKFTASEAHGTKYDMGRGSLRIEGGDNTVARLADNLAAVLGRPVVDGTGVKGRYLMALRWAPEDSASDPGLPSIFAALEEQLGLRLEAGKGPVSVLVIDRAEMPSAN